MQEEQTPNYCITSIKDYLNNDAKKIVTYGLCHLDLDLSTIKRIFGKYKKIHNHQTQNNLFKKGKISK